MCDHTLSELEEKKKKKRKEEKEGHEDAETTEMCGRFLNWNETVKWQSEGLWSV